MQRKNKINLHRKKKPPYLCGMFHQKKQSMEIKAHKAYLIDVAEKTIKDIEIRDWTQIRLWIGEDCEHFTCPISFANGDTIYADDEGLFNPITGGIVVPDLQQIIVGNVVVLGGDYKTGESKDVEFSKEELSKLFYFINKAQAIHYAGTVGGNGFIVPSIN